MKGLEKCFSEQKEAEDTKTQEERLRQVGGGAAMERVSVQQPEAKASQGGKEDKGQGRGGPRGWVIAVVLVAAGGVIGQA